MGAPMRARRLLPAVMVRVAAAAAATDTETHDSRLSAQRSRTSELVVSCIERDRERSSFNHTTTNTNLSGGIEGLG